MKTAFLILTLSAAALFQAGAAAPSSTPLPQADPITKTAQALTASVGLQPTMVFWGWKTISLTSACCVAMIIGLCMRSIEHIVASGLCLAVVLFGFGAFFRMEQRYVEIDNAKTTAWALGLSTAIHNPTAEIKDVVLRGYETSFTVAIPQKTEEFQTNILGKTTTAKRIVQEAATWSVNNASFLALENSDATIAGVPVRDALEIARNP